MIFRNARWHLEFRLCPSRALVFSTFERGTFLVFGFLLFPHQPEPATKKQLASLCHCSFTRVVLDGLRDLSPSDVKKMDVAPPEQNYAQKASADDRIDQVCINQYNERPGH